MIEEPDCHLHIESIVNLFRVIESASNEGKQILISTHSPLFVDLVSIDNLFTIVKEDGETKVVKGDTDHQCRK